MPHIKKSLPEYIMDENHFKDFEYEFDYCIIHQENDLNYFAGTLTNALSEFITFQDNESFAYFLAQLLQSKILIPVHIYPSGQNDKSIMKLPKCKNDSYLHMQKANIVPQIKIANKTRFFGMFLSIREIQSIAPHNTFIYIAFDTVYKWIKKHHPEIDTIVFDAFSKYEYSWCIDTDDFIKQIESFKKFAKKYNPRNLTSYLHRTSMQKRIVK